MHDLIGQATAFIMEHRAWAGPIMGVLAFAESLVLLGMLVPATAIMFAVGGMMGLGLVDPWHVLAWSVAGAALGDWVSYLIGAAIGPSIYRRWPLNRHLTAVARARLFFRRYGFIAIVLGRLFGPLRATVPVVAGVMRMQASRFQLANVLSAVVWVPAILAPGYLATQGMSSVGDIGTTELATIAGLTVAFVLAGTLAAAWMVRRSGGRTRVRPRAQLPRE